MVTEQKPTYRADFFFKPHELVEHIFRKPWEECFGFKEYDSWVLKETEPLGKSCYKEES